MLLLMGHDTLFYSKVSVEMRMRMWCCYCAGHTEQGSWCCGQTSAADSTGNGVLPPTTAITITQTEASHHATSQDKRDAVHKQVPLQR